MVKIVTTFLINELKTIATRAGIDYLLGYFLAFFDTII